VGAAPVGVAGSPGAARLMGGWGGRLGGVLPTSGGAGAGAGGAVGGGWLLAGGALPGKLAVGCLLALGLGAGCVTIEGRVGTRPHAHRRAARVARTDRGHARNAADAASLLAGTPPAPGQSTLASTLGAGAGSLASAGRASREFGPERAPTAGPQSGTGAAGAASTHQRLAHGASAAGGPERVAGGERGGEARAPAPSASTASVSSQVSATSATQASREFSPG
jgi:hypothetical protein